MRHRPTPPDRAARPTRGTRAARIPALAALAVAATGCGFAGVEDTDAGAGGGAGQRLAYAYAFTPVAALSPYSDDAVTSYGAGATETLAALDPAGTPRPSLATSWERVEPTVWRVELRDGVTFHDGTPMTAEVVADGLDDAAAARPLPRALTGVELDATAEDEDTLVVRTAEPDPVLVSRLTSPELAVLSPAAYDDPAAPSPVGTGTGPYEITGLDGTAGATLDAFADYWGGSPAMAGVDLAFVAAGGSRVSAFRAGQVDLAQAVPAADLGSIDPAQVVAVPLPRTVSVHLTQTSPVFDDPALRATAREAITALDLAGSVYDGYADPAEGLFAPEVSPWAADRPAPDLPEAGDPGGASITLATFSDRPELPEAATAVADALRDRGFEVEVVVQQYDQIEGALLDGTFDAVVMSRSYGQDTADPVSYLQTDFGCDGSYNLSRLCSDGIDARLAAAADSSDLATRERAAVAVETELLSQVAVVPLVHDRTQFAADGVRDLARDPWERAVVTAATSLS